ncbi:hypothetical protein [Paenibacillus sp. YAF4_2]|uniref:hypothetical protein n=1 Tax=Paenibacillus sp. YAF4_2 TaxID=3233085 RepID=UPI003F9D2593
MRRNCKLILVEGLCGTGKSTLAERLNGYLAKKDISSHFYDEGAVRHPTSLNGHAFFREVEYKELLERYPIAADEISSRVINDESYYLIPYRESMAPFNGMEALYSELKSHELCWTPSPVATLTEFTYLIQGQWSRFANLASTSDEVYVLEAVFFQHQIHDLLRHYQVDDYQIEQHIKGIADQIAAMNPVLIYLAQPSVREQQIWISSIRSKHHYATEQSIRFMEYRKKIELRLIDLLPFATYLIENENRDWEEVFSKVVWAIGSKC